MLLQDCTLLIVHGYCKTSSKDTFKKKKSFQRLLSLSSCPQHPLFSHPKISHLYFIPDCKISIKSETWQELGEQFLSKGKTNLKRILVIYKYLKTATTKSKFCVSDTFMYWSNWKQLCIKIQFCKSAHFHKENYPLKLLLKGHLACRDLPLLSYTPVSRMGMNQHPINL